MDRQTALAILRDLKTLKRTSVRFRRGEVTGTSPLAVSLGDGTPQAGVKSIATGLQVGDQVAVIVFGSDMLVLGKIGDGSFTEVRGQATITGTGASFADVVVTDDLGTATKRGNADEHVGGTFVGDVTICRVASTTTNTTTLRAITRLGGNITVGQTVLVDYRIWK